MIKKMGFGWRLRLVMAEHDLFATSDLVPLLAERGVVLSREQVYRLVTQSPQRLNMDVLVALCDIFACTPNDLIEPQVTSVQVDKGATATGTGRPEGSRRTVIRRPDGA